MKRLYTGKDGTLAIWYLETPDEKLTGIDSWGRDTNPATIPPAIYQKVANQGKSCYGRDARNLFNHSGPSIVIRVVELGDDALLYPKENEFGKVSP